MFLRHGMFSDMANEIKERDYRLIIFGSGLMGTITVPYILKERGLWDRVKCYIDNDEKKCNTEVNGKKVYLPQKLSAIDGKRTAILISLSRFADVLRQLNEFENLNQTVCFPIALMCLENFKPVGYDATCKDYDIPKIPRTIHYIWFGREKMSKLLTDCLHSWQKYCPNFNIKCWNEDNYDVHKNEYIHNAYTNKKYGFAADYARLDILYNEGGIYFDTDVELLRNLDDMLYQDAFCSTEKWQTLNSGGGIGAVKHHPAIKELLKERQKLRFLNDYRFNLNTCGYYETLTMQKYGYKLSGKIQSVMGMNIYPYEYFHPYDDISGKTDILPYTYAVHHFDSSWLSKAMKASNERTMTVVQKLAKESD